MNRLFSRLLTLALIPCLTADPAWPAALSRNTPRPLAADAVLQAQAPLHRLAEHLGEDAYRDLQRGVENALAVTRIGAQLIKAGYTRLSLDWTLNAEGRLRSVDIIGDRPAPAHRATASSA